MNTMSANAVSIDARSQPGPQAQLQVAAWLLACCALVFAMVVVGGVTRLTHSGLSIVEWQPILGTLPPMNEAQWLETFGKYQLTPEYQKVNQGMSLDAFKSIFWWEYFHRLLGRVIGRPDTGVIAILDDGITTALVHTLDVAELGPVSAPPLSASGPVSEVG